LRSFLIAGLLLLAACAPQYVPGWAPAPEDIPSLETQLRDRPTNRDVRTLLGAAYLENGQPEAALEVLEPITGAGPELLALLTRGGALEELGRLDDARENYERLLRLTGTDQPEIRRATEARIALVRRLQLEAEVRGSLGREAELTGRQTELGTVAVLPFIFEGGDPRYEPLGRALAEMVVTDLGAIDRIRVLERLRVQLLLEELVLADPGEVDSATAARSGRILGAAQVIQGRVEGDDDGVSVMAALVPTRVDAVRASLDEQDELLAFFDLQKRLVLALVQEMRIQLTSTERERIQQRPTEDLEAILLFGRGLEAEDRGDFAAATRYFRQAAEADPGFGAARERAHDAEVLAGQVAITPRHLPGLVLARMPSPPEVPLSVERLRIVLADIDALVPGPEVRDPGPELLGNEGVALGPALLEIILRWP
jgi:tetratricopeptide (TPR) repeat protein